MSKIYLISFDPKSQDFDYSKFFDKIKSYGSWQHPLEYIWTIRVEETITANSIYIELKPLLSKKDRLLVVQVDKFNKQGWLSKSFWEWFNVMD